MATLNREKNNQRKAVSNARTMLVNKPICKPMLRLANAGKLTWWAVRSFPDILLV